MKTVFLDFEFFNSEERDLSLVSCALQAYNGKALKYVRNFWLMDARQVFEAKNFFRQIISEGYVFVGFAFEAEARALLTLFGMETYWINRLKCIDLYLEYRCLLNRNHKFAYGEQLVKGKVITTTPPPSKYERVDEDEEDEAHHKPSYSLAAAVFKLFSIRIDTDEKEAVRSLILSKNKALILTNRKRIEEYNASDIVYLPRLLGFFRDYYRKQGMDLKKLLPIMLGRGDYALRTAKMVRLGYPVNVERVKKFTQNIHNILNAAVRDVLDSTTEFEAFRWDKKDNRWRCNEKKIREWAEAQGKPYWRKTATNQFSLKKEAFKDWYSSETLGFAGAYCRYLKTKQSLNGFMPGGKKGKFSDYLGTDGRVRPHFGIFGSQSSRSQPGAVGFLPLKAKWMRSFIEPPKGHAIFGADYASQEFLIAAIISQDDEMLAAYESGDVYMAFGIQAGLITPSMSAEAKQMMRDFCKAIVLGMSYDMTAKGLAPRIGKTEKEAQGYIDLFFATYSEYAKWKRETWKEYLSDGMLALSDGWILWGDNRDQRRSTLNFPIQGEGAVIMREAVKRAQNEGLDIIYTLHDALYIEFLSQQFCCIDILVRCMKEAFQHVMSKYGRTVPVRIDGKAWSRDYGSSGSVKQIAGVSFMQEYIDKKGEADYTRYKEFFS